MKFSCTQENLNQGLSVVSHVAGKNINLPILGNVLMKCDDSGLQLVSTNLEVAVQCTVRGKVETKGDFTVPSKLFADYVSLLPKERVDVEKLGETLAISCGSYQTKVKGIPASEFPLIPTIDGSIYFSMRIGDLRKAISQVVFAVAPNESRPEISGVLFKFAPADPGMELVLAATDSYRLAERTIRIDVTNSSPVTDPLSVIVPARTVSELMRIIGVYKDGMDEKDPINVSISDNQIAFSVGSAELISRTIEGKYPDYRQLIPDSFETDVVMTKEEVARAIRATSLFSRSGLNDVHFVFDPQEGIKLSAINSQTGEQAAEIDGAVSGKRNEVTVNFKYLLDGINSLDAEHVIFQLNDSMSPCVVRGYKDGGPLQDHLYIVMPIRQ